jgi:soluble lytic murein transglycosylase-like protein
MRRRLVATSSFALAVGLGVTSLTDSSVSLAASETAPASGLSGQRVLVEQLQVAARAQRAEEAQARAQLETAAAAEAERIRQAAAADAARAAAAVRAARVSRAVPPVSGPFDWKSLVARYPWDVVVAERIVWCESRGNINARNRSGATGLFQILGGPIDPVANVATAYDMYRARGWQPWSASRSCWS